MRVTAGHLNETFEYLEEEWKSLIPNVPFEGFFQHAIFDEFFRTTRGISHVFIAVAAMALLLALGLIVRISRR